MRVIWLYDVGSTGCSAKALTIAASLPVVTDVMVHAHHAVDYGLWCDRAADACLIARRAGKRLIWSRGLGPTDHPAGFSPSDLGDSAYYVRAVESVRAEGRMLGADAVALDTEPYSSCPWKQNKTQPPTGDTLAAIHAAVVEAIRRVGTIDYVWPAGSRTAGDWYQQIALLGRQRITESTYAGDYAAWSKIPHPYEVVGLWINTVDRGPGATYRQYVPVVELTRAFREADGRDVFLLPFRPDLAVAEAVRKETA